MTHILPLVYNNDIPQRENTIQLHLRMVLPWRLTVRNDVEKATTNLQRASDRLYQTVEDLRTETITYLFFPNKNLRNQLPVTINGNIIRHGNIEKYHGIEREQEIWAYRIIN